MTELQGKIVASLSRHRRRKELSIMLKYKVVETSQVDDLTLEAILNTWTPKGWRFEGIHFAMRDSSRRPGMAFVTFTREDDES